MHRALAATGAATAIRTASRLKRQWTFLGAGDNPPPPNFFDNFSVFQAYAFQRTLVVMDLPAADLGPTFKGWRGTSGFVLSHAGENAHERMRARKEASRALSIVSCLRRPIRTPDDQEAQRRLAA